MDTERIKGVVTEFRKKTVVARFMATALLLAGVCAIVANPNSQVQASEPRSSAGVRLFFPEIMKNGSPDSPRPLPLPDFTPVSTATASSTATEPKPKEKPTDTATPTPTATSTLFPFPKPIEKPTESPTAKATPTGIVCPPGFMPGGSGEDGICQQLPIEPTIVVNTPVVGTPVSIIEPICNIDASGNVICPGSGTPSAVIITTAIPNVSSTPEVPNCNIDQSGNVSCANPSQTPVLVIPTPQLN